MRAGVERKGGARHRIAGAADDEVAVHVEAAAAVAIVQGSAGDVEVVAQAIAGLADGRGAVAHAQPLAAGGIVLEPQAHGARQRAEAFFLEPGEHDRHVERGRVVVAVELDGVDRQAERARARRLPELGDATCGDDRQAVAGAQLAVVVGVVERDPDRAAQAARRQRRRCQRLLARRRQRAERQTHPALALQAQALTARLRRVACARNAQHVGIAGTEHSARQRAGKTRDVGLGDVRRRRGRAAARALRHLHAAGCVVAAAAARRQRRQNAQRNPSPQFESHQELLFVCWPAPVAAAIDQCGVTGMTRTSSHLCLRWSIKHLRKLCTNRLQLCLRGRE